MERMKFIGIKVAFEIFCYTFAVEYESIIICIKI